MTFCQFGLDERVVRGDPVAGRLLANLVRPAPAPPAATAAAVLVAGPRAEAFVRDLGLAVDPWDGAAIPADRLVILAEGWAGRLAGGEAALQAHLARGGTLVLLGVEPPPWLPVALPGDWERGYRLARDVAPDPLLEGIGPGLVRWRVPVRIWRAAAAGLPAGSTRLLDGGALVPPPLRRALRPGFSLIELLVVISAGPGCWPTPATGRGSCPTPVCRPRASPTAGPTPWPPAATPTTG